MNSTVTVDSDCIHNALGNHFILDILMEEACITLIDHPTHMASIATKGPNGAEGALHITTSHISVVTTLLPGP